MITFNSSIKPFLIKRFIAGLFVFLCCCKQNETISFREIDPITEPDKEVSRLSEIASDISYIPLQTTDHSLIGHIFSMKATSNRFYFQTISENV